MNYELSTEVIKILDDLGKRFGVAIDWADKNVMPYLMELYDRFITYKIVVNCIPIVLFVVFATVFIIMLVKYFKYKNLAEKTLESNFFFDVHKYQYSEDVIRSTSISDGLLFASGGATVLSGFASLLVGGNLLKLIFIPEVYMVEYLMNYM